MTDFDNKTFLLQRIALADPSIDTTDASQWSALVGRPVQNYTSGLGALIANDDIARDLRKSEQMTFDQVAAFASNFFVDPKTGTSSTGTVNIFFIAPQDVNIALGQAFTADNGTRYFASASLQITAAQVSAQFDSNYGGYRVDVPNVTSTGFGSDYSIVAGSIVAMDNETANVLLVTNLSDFSKSVAAETKAELAARIPDAASQRNYCSTDSTKALLKNDPRVLAVTVIGAGDVEMVRDIQFGGIHSNGLQNTLVYAAEPLIVTAVDQPIQPDFLPTFVFYGHDITAGVMNPALPIGANAGPVVAVEKVEYGTGSGNGFLPIGTLANGEDFVYEFMPGGSAATKNSPEEFWRIALIKRPPSPATTVRATVLRNTLPSILQTELFPTGARAPAQATLFFGFTVALVDITATVRPLPGASNDPAVYEAALAALIRSTPIAGEVDQSDLVDILVRAGADEVFLPVKAEAAVYYPDLVVATVELQSGLDVAAFDRGPYTARTIGLYPGVITVTVTT